MEYEELTIDFADQFSKPYYVGNNSLQDEQAQPAGFDLDPSFILWRHELTPLGSTLSTDNGSVNSAAAAATAKKAPHSYIPFSSADSMRLENTYRGYSAETRHQGGNADDFCVLVRDCMYDVRFEAIKHEGFNPDSLEMESIYWESSNCDVTRHVWFVNQDKKGAPMGCSGKDYFSKRCFFSKSTSEITAAASPYIWSPCVQLLSLALEYVYQDVLKNRQYISKPLFVKIKQASFHFIVHSAQDIYVFENSMFNTKSADGRKDGCAVRRGLPPLLRLAGDQLSQEEETTRINNEKQAKARKLSRQQSTSNINASSSENPPEYTPLPESYNRAEKHNAETWADANRIKRKDTESSSNEKNTIKNVRYFFPEIEHLIFVVHGIGQKIENLDIIWECQLLRQKIKEQYDALDHDRIMLVPIQWRKGLELKCDNPFYDELNNGGLASPQGASVLIDDVTLSGIKPLRNLLNSSFMDVLYYLNLGCSQKIFDSLSNRLNIAYDKFLVRHKDFFLNGGKVSLLGHSLGSLLCWDLVCNQGISESMQEEILQEQLIEKFTKVFPDDDEQTVEEKNTLKELAQKLVKKRNEQNSQLSAQHIEAENLVPKNGLIYQQLPFDVNSLFLIGSPIGVFLAVKGTEISCEGNPLTFHTKCMPICNQVYNIFHPYDPVAYRLEPFIKKSLTHKKPMLVPYHEGGIRFHHKVNNVLDDIEATTNQWKNTLVGTFASFTSGIMTAKKAAADTSQTQERILTADEREAERTLEAFNSDKRLDWVLQEAPLENQYISAISSHISYWDSPDIALFLLSKLSPAPIAVELPLD